MAGDNHTVIIQHGRQNLLAVKREDPGDCILQAFAPRRPNIIRSPPKVDLFVPPSPDGIVLVKTAQNAIVAFIERAIAHDLQLWRAELGKNQLQGTPRANKVGTKGPVEGLALRLEAAPGGTRFLYPSV